jgi:hypothetical protein
VERCQYRQHRVLGDFLCIRIRTQHCTHGPKHTIDMQSIQALRRRTIAGPCHFDQLQDRVFFEWSGVAAKAGGERVEERDRPLVE